MIHDWHETGYCTHCGILKGYHAEECLATPNVHGMMHLLAKRAMERGREKAALTSVQFPAPTGEGGVTNIIVEKFPPESS